jgi:hypothetical protein
LGNHDVLTRRECEVKRPLTKGTLLTCGQLPIDRIHCDRATGDAEYIAIIEDIVLAIDREGALGRRNLRLHADRFDDGLGIVPGHIERLSAPSEEQQQSAGGVRPEPPPSSGIAQTSWRVTSLSSVWQRRLSLANSSGFTRMPMISSGAATFATAS